MRRKVGLIVCTLNPGANWRSWCSLVIRQRELVAVVVVDSSSTDKSVVGNLPDSWSLISISQRDFRHGSARNLGVSRLIERHDIVVFMTQDAFLADPSSISKLISAFDDDSVACVWGRQLPHKDASAIAAHAREFNYPAGSRVLSLCDKDEFGIKTCFNSNSFAAYRACDLKAVGGFPADVILGEDMAVAARLLMAGKRVAYAAEACVYHSHNYTVAQDFRRYFDTGVFHARNTWLLQTFGQPTGEGLRFVRSELAYLWRHAPFCIPSAMVRTVAKWLGYRLGRAERLLPLWCKPWLSMHKAYWRQQGAR